MSSSSSDDESNNLEYWNNWVPLKENVEIVSRNTNEKVVFTDNHNFKFHSTLKEESMLGNWIPPCNLNTDNNGRCEYKKYKTMPYTEENEDPLIKNNSIDDSFGQLKKNPVVNNISWERVLNKDWGERVELHDVSHYCDEKLIWGVVTPGSFGSIKLWVNEYGNLCGSADGKICKEGTLESTLITINNTNLLKKMLNLNNIQWNSLIDLILQNKSSLNFDAFNNIDDNKMNSLDKLWFYICKRRHFLSDQCMLVKLCGAVKSLKEFKIIPKLIVQDIRNINGHPII